MTPTPRLSALLASLALVLASACTTTTDTAGNTELNLTIVNPGGTSGELGFEVDRVDYRITCAGNPPGSYPIPDADTSGTDYNYDDSVDISGAFEIVDTRTPPVWQSIMDLPPGPCTITLSVYDGDEIVCVGSQTLAILEDGTTKYDIALVCSLSIDTPDGMADIDGEFEFITGNICPKLYIVNAIPSGISNDNTCTATQLSCATDADCQPPNPGGIPGQLCNVNTEIQFRTKDPDNTCGNNCDPQSCTFDNPPVCTPYPSNFLDAACHPSAGGDPNDPACLAGDHAGLVCQITGIPSATGVPGGSWISPNDLVTPLGLPSFLVNLNTVSGIPGIVLPGLGGPAGTNAANSPAYPPLPNVNGSLPALRYVCDTSIPGDVTIQVVCTDGDLECTQVKQLTINCPGTNQCTADPVPDCSAPHDCATAGTGGDTTVPGCDPLCAPACDPSEPAYDPVACAAEPPPNNVDCERCPGQGTYLPNGTACNVGEFGTLGNVCLLGFCVECIISDNGPGGNPLCTDSPSTPVDCQLPNTCVSNSCAAGGAAPAGTPCSNGVCDGSGIGPAACQFQACDPCESDCGQTPTSCANPLTMGCTNNVTADISILPFQLDVNPDQIVVAGGAPVSVPTIFGGIAEFSEVFLDAAQGAVPGGVTQADLVNLAATVQIRTGGTLDAPVTLTNGPLATTCLIGGAACDPANDGASVPGSQPNTDCIPTGTFNPCQALVAVPTSSDCTPGGVCDALGKLASQCAVNGFCATGGLALPLEPQAGSFTPAASGIVNFGFADQGTGATINADGTYALPAAVFTGPTQLNEIKVNASGLSVALVCTMAVDAGGPDGPSPPVPDQASPTPTSLLSSFNIQTTP